jgi:hypothetical protein
LTFATRYGTKRARIGYIGIDQIDLSISLLMLHCAKRCWSEGIIFTNKLFITIFSQWPAVVLPVSPHVVDIRCTKLCYQWALQFEQYYDVMGNRSEMKLQKWPYSCSWLLFIFHSGIYICIVVLIKILFRYWCISYDGHILTIVRENCNAISYSVHTSFQSLKFFVKIKLYGYGKY